MPLSPQQLHEVKSYLRRTAPDIDRPEERMSRRIEGEVELGTGDAQGYRTVVAYMEKGLEDQRESVEKVLDIVCHLQSDFSLEYLVCLFSFGWEDGRLHHGGCARHANYLSRGRKWADELAGLAGPELPRGPAVIPSLFPFSDPYGHKTNVDRDDLLLFFVRSGVTMAEPALKRYSRASQRNAIWFVVRGDGIEVVCGAHQPAPAPANPSPGRGPGLAARTTPGAPSQSAPPTQPGGSGQGRGPRGRGLRPAFMDDLSRGLLEPVLRMVKADPTLSLNIRDGYINIYYRGGSLLRIDERPGGGYRFVFDAQYMSSPQFSLFAHVQAAVATLPQVVCGPGQVMAWLLQFPCLKTAIDLFGQVKQSCEREFQQVVERTNNENHATDFFIIDLEYAGNDQRLDLVALHWPSTSAARRARHPKRLAVIEMKYQDGALKGSSGLVAHARNLASLVAGGTFLPDFADEMRDVFNQRVELGLIQCHSAKGKVARSLQDGEIDPEGLEYILLLADHDPAKCPLLPELRELAAMNLPFPVFVSTANFMGYGLFDEALYPLEAFLERFPEQICSKSEVDQLDVDEVEEDEPRREDEFAAEGRPRRVRTVQPGDYNLSTDLTIEITRRHSTWEIHKNYEAVLFGDGRVQSRDMLQIVDAPRRASEAAMRRVLDCLFGSSVLRVRSREFENPNRYVMDAGGPTILRVRLGKDEWWWKSGSADYWGKSRKAFGALIEAIEAALNEAGIKRNPF